MTTFSRIAARRLERGEPVAATWSATRDAHVGFVGIHPVLVDGSVERYAVVRFEVAKDRLEWDLTDDLLEDIVDVRVDDQAALEQQLSTWGVALDAFQAPQRVGYPK